MKTNRRWIVLLAVLAVVILLARLIASTIQASQNGSGGVQLTLTVSVITIVVVILAAGVPIYVFYRRRTMGISELRAQFPGSVIITGIGYDEFAVGIVRLGRSEFGAAWQASVHTTKRTRFTLLVFSADGLTLWNASSKPTQVGAIPNSLIASIGTGTIAYAYGERVSLVVTVGLTGQSIRLPWLVMKDTGGGILPRDSAGISKVLQAIHDIVQTDS
ncbi:hypothetical protein [Subtercola vilae]|uniref:Uncharacterized protein n=1 Tax=Subtercola vilae TaxID=2056433 RepID=A0A4T2B7I7_9MICO|nr:hypothetical protein [Subtercola vilae]TIH26219.1 hypothetical protein D4765_18980 [Subtercola vilae]